MSLSISQRILLFGMASVLVATFLSFWLSRQTGDSFFDKSLEYTEGLPLTGSGRPIRDHSFHPAPTPVKEQSEDEDRLPSSYNGNSVEISKKAGIAATSFTAEMRMHHIGSMIHDYHNAYGQNPVGSNLEITAVLLGKNEKHTQFIRSEDPNLNARGELQDHWGTAYFFHQVSGMIMEIRSAGPDKSMWTDDDMLVK